MNISSELINFYALTEVTNGSSATRIYEKLAAAHGEHRIPSLRHIQRICKEIKDGERTNTGRKEGSRRTRSSRTDDNLEAVRQLIEDDPSLSIFHNSTRRYEKETL